MRHYPTMLDLRGQHCLVIGAGEVGKRKLTALLACEPAEVLVVDPRPSEECLADFLEGPVVIHACRGFEESDLDGRFLVVAASADPELNDRVGQACRSRGLLCNVVTNPEAGNFIVPAHFHQGDMTVALSTGGLSPALARVVRRDLQEHLASRYDTFLRFMGRLRPMILALEQPQAENARVFRDMVESPLAAALADGDRPRAERLLVGLLPSSLAGRMEELLDGLV